MTLVAIILGAGGAILFAYCYHQWRTVEHDDQAEQWRTRLDRLVHDEAGDETVRVVRP